MVENKNVIPLSDFLKQKFDFTIKLISQKNKSASFRSFLYV